MHPPLSMLVSALNTRPPKGYLPQPAGTLILYLQQNQPLYLPEVDILKMTLSQMEQTY